LRNGSDLIYNILLIQDDAQSARTVHEALASLHWHFHVEWVKTCELGLQQLTALGKQHQQQSVGIAAVLVDLQLPDVNGIDTFTRLYAIAPPIPILILSSLQDEAIAKLAVQRGAQDYLLKTRIDDYLLPKAIAGVIDRAMIMETLFEEKERAQVMLNSIGDAVISTDVDGKVTYLNLVAEQLTGWPRAHALGHPLEDVFRIIDAESRATVPNPMALAAMGNKLVGLPTSCILIRRDGVEAAIEDSCAPIHDRFGQVTGAVMVFHDISAARAAMAKLAYLAQHDALTDLPNRGLLDDRLTQAIIMAHRHNTSLALIYVDLDRFKHINDSLGHVVGDRLLQSVALRLSECVRASDTVSRQGGDEFVILLSEISLAQDAVLCADKIIQAVKLPYVIDEHELYVTASIGIVLYPGDGNDVETLLQNADSAMYEAKAYGRNNYRFYRSDVNTEAAKRQSVESDLRHAIQQNNFELHYQPLMHLATGRIAGVEALIRWRHPTLGLVLPTQFIPIAEESGLIVPIGQWALREACRQFIAWEGRPPSFRLAVNISTVELRSKTFVEGVTAILTETGFDPASLDLEITETYLMQDSKSTAVVLSGLKEIGVHLALDDFGTGYSSLSYVRRFPIDTLKIDRSFVRNLTTDTDDASVVRAVIQMGRSLRMRVVAEGVETPDQLHFLEENDCSEAQGFYFSRPLPGDGLVAFLSRAVAKPNVATERALAKRLAPM
jgi:diguanylate cyclase (GGDEF)-like protein/PAS domain S-box-containing protein